MVDDFDTRVLERRPKRSKWAVVGWLLFLLVLGAAVAAIKYLYLPLKADRDRLDRALSEAAVREQKLHHELSDTETRATTLASKGEELSGKLAQTVAEREALENELKRVQGELQAILEPQISAGNVHIKRRGNELVVDVSDKILFDSGHAEINEGGQKVLAEVVPSLARLKGYTVQVGGHTDSARVVNPETQERFPTNWELSTARATNVVRFLEEKGKIPGTRLEAAGFAQYRPVAGNGNADDRQKNRRIELVLIQTGALTGSAATGTATAAK
ncbi:MAG TPA: flagellar motor protein MotB [Polyangiaceae bacterium]|nr:flagellar motor protein MotB [Polyangiaceae bacterium]